MSSFKISGSEGDQKTGLTIAATDDATADVEIVVKDSSIDKGETVRLLNYAILRVIEGDWPPA